MQFRFGYIEPYHTYIYIYRFMYMCLLYLYLHAFIFVCIYIYMYLYMYMYMCIYVCIFVARDLCSVLSLRSWVIRHVVRVYLGGVPACSLQQDTQQDGPSIYP